MAIPPFNDLRLNPGEEKDPRRLRELFEGMTRNFEDLYNRYATGTEVREAVNTKPIVDGAVTGAGGINNGHGFTVLRTAVGAYTITLTKELGVPGILLAMQIGGTLPCVMITGVPAKKIFVVEAYQSSNATLTRLDTAFNFWIKAES